MSSAPSFQEIQGYAQSFDVQKARTFQSSVKKKGFGHQFRTLVGMMADSGFKVQDKTKLTIAGALAYVVMPIDLIPDLAPVVGWLDDGAVMKIVWDSAKGEVKRYAQHLAGRGLEVCVAGRGVGEERGDPQHLAGRGLEVCVGCKKPCGRCPR